VQEAFHIGAGFADWLRSECSSGRKECTVFLRVAIGRDPRLSGEPIVDAVCALKGFWVRVPVYLLVCVGGCWCSRVVTAYCAWYRGSALEL
jgi:hypothetical protein